MQPEVMTGSESSEEQAAPVLRGPRPFRPPHISAVIAGLDPQ